MTTNTEEINDHFRLFAAALQRAISKYGYVQGDRKAHKRLQAEQLRRLMAAEESFRLRLINNPLAPRIYRAFVELVCETKGNVLSARPYLRERQDLFTAEIAPVLKACSKAPEDKHGWKPLRRFRVNHDFIRFALSLVPDSDWGRKVSAKMREAAEEAASARSELAELNLPLAVSRARIFWGRTSRGTRAKLTFMEYVQIAAVGLLAAIDKFVPAVQDPTDDALVEGFEAKVEAKADLVFSQETRSLEESALVDDKACDVFPSVAITRMSGSFIEAYSETMIHYYPADRRRLYRAHKVLSKNPDGAVSEEELVNEVNRGVDPKRWVSADEIHDLLAAVDPVVTDTKVEDGEVVATEVIDGLAAADDLRPDVASESREVLGVLHAAVADALRLWERKLLRMRGIEVEL